MGSRMAEVITTTFLFIAMALSWIAFVQVGFFHHDAHVALAPLHSVRATSRSIGRCASTR